MNAADLTPYFITVIGAFFMLGVMSRWTDHKNKRGASDRSQMWPTAAVTMGIIGTFVGIYLGLQGFDTSAGGNLDTLLNGLKTAFLTSICGLIASLVLKLWDAILSPLLPQTEPSGASEDPVELLQHIAATSLDAGKASERALRDIQHELQETREASFELSDAFRNELVEVTASSLKEAMEQVVEAFDANLNERTASTFEELKASLDAVVTWQTDHREEMAQAHTSLSTCVGELERATQAMTKSGESIEKLEPVLHHISTSVDTVAEDSGALALAANQLRTDTERLQAMLSALEVLGASAKAAVPAINEQLEAYTSKLFETVEASNERSTKATEQAGAAMEASGQRLIALQTEQEEKLAEHLESYTASLMKALEATNTKTEEMAKRIQGTMEQSATQLTTLQDQQGAKLTESLGTLTEGLNVALATSLEQLVGALALLSERFVDDYTPLTERLREVVRLAEAGPPKAAPHVEALYDPDILEDTEDPLGEDSAASSEPVDEELNDG